MNQTNGNGILGLFITLVVITFVVSLFSTILGYLFPFLLIIGFLVVSWKIIKNVLGLNQDASQTTKKGRNTESQRRTTKTDLPKDSIDVEYTIVEDDETDTE